MACHLFGSKPLPAGLLGTNRSEIQTGILHHFYLKMNLKLLFAKMVAILSREMS